MSYDRKEWERDVRFRRQNSDEEALRREELKKNFWERDRRLFHETDPSKMTSAEWDDWADRL